MGVCVTLSHTDRSFAAGDFKMFLVLCVAVVSAGWKFKGIKLVVFYDLGKYDKQFILRTMYILKKKKLRHTKHMVELYMFLNNDFLP